MSYFNEISDYATYSGHEADFHFSYNANSGGGQAFLGGRFYDENGHLTSPETLNGRIVAFKYLFRTENGEEVSVVIDDEKAKYEVKPRGNGSTSMKLGIGTDRVSPSKVVSAFMMLPPTCGVKTPSNDEKATAIIQHITYNVLDEHYDTDIFTEPTIKGKLGTNAMKAQRHLYDHIMYDSTNERDFAADLDTNTDVAVYVKLPDSFYIATPVGHYNPDWAIAFYEGTVKHIYFVAETKGSMSSMQLRLIEESKIHCAREHFKAISNGNVVYDVVDSYQTLLERVMK